MPKYKLSPIERAAEKERKDSVISSKRGRLIRLIKEEIKKIKSTEELSTEDQESLENLQKMLETELGNHKDHLKLTYKEDFLAERATVPAIFTVLPKGVGIQFKRVLNCIDELKEAIDDGCKVLAYCTWSFTDLLSWLNGYQKRYGFVYIDRDEYNVKDLKRIKKKQARDGVPSECKKHECYMSRGKRRKETIQFSFSI